MKAIAFAAMGALLACQAAADVLDRITETGVIRLGVRTDAPPFSYTSQLGEPTGLAVLLCRDAAKEIKASLALDVLTVEYVAVTASTRFEKLEKLDREYALDQSITECPKRFVSDVEQMITDLSALEIASVVQGAETLSVCTQQGRQAVDNRMSELAQSSDLNAARERLSLGGVLNRWANADVDLSAAVGSLVFYDRRRARLTTAAEGIRQRCQLLKGIYE